MGLLSQWVGMLTDSRSFLSYPRHDYFRRLLCNILGKEMDNGRLPDDIGLVGTMVKDICYFNARRYFRFPPYEQTGRTGFEKAGRIPEQQGTVQ
jgi:glucuronate isomerase